MRPLRTFAWKMLWSASLGERAMGPLFSFLARRHRFDRPGGNVLGLSRDLAVESGCCRGCRSGFGWLFRCSLGPGRPDSFLAPRAGRRPTGHPPRHWRNNRACQCYLVRIASNSTFADRATIARLPPEAYFAPLAAVGEVRCLAGNPGRREWRESGGEPKGNFDPQLTLKALTMTCRCE